MNVKTKTIAGNNVTLEVGIRYLASRPMAETGRTVYPITIRIIGEEVENFKVIQVIDGLSYDAANDFLAAFNDGISSFNGRVW